MSVNRIMLLGRLGRDPELRQTGNGKSVCNFSLATSEKWGDREETTWHNIVCWGKTAEHCAKYLTKGREAFIEGRLTKRSYESKTGEKREAVEVVADRVTFVGAGAKRQESNALPEASVDASLDDIPF